MAVSVSHPTAADASFSAGGATAWNEAHTVTGLGDSAEKNVGTAAGTVAAGDHLHTGVYQPVDADLTALAALAGTGGWAKRTAADTWAISTPTAADVGADASGTAASAVTTHEAAADPHTGYQRESEKNAASGYAGLDGSSKLTGSQQVYGTLANTACQGNDSRLSDARTPTAHAASHNSGGSDALTVTSLGGYPGGTSNFLRSDGTFAAPTAAAADPSYSPGSFTVATETGRLVINHLKLATTQRVTIEGTGRLAIGF